jgi:MFS family permease
VNRRGRVHVLAICCMSILLVSLDNTIVNVALPTIHRHLGASLSQLQWIVDAYTVVLATLLILCGSIADRIGRKKVFGVGLGLFVTGSLLCNTAPSPFRNFSEFFFRCSPDCLFLPFNTGLSRSNFRGVRPSADRSVLHGLELSGLSIAL